MRPRSFVIASLWLVACGGPQPTPPVDPQACILGDFEGAGVDDGGVRWTFTLRLREQGPDLVGSFHWVGSDGAIGDEQVRGHADCVHGTFVWTGQSASGGSTDEDIVTAHYGGTIGGNGATLSGQWSDTQGNGGVPGSFTARRR
jgi:hypothetical protein